MIEANVKNGSEISHHGKINAIKKQDPEMLAQNDGTKKKCTETRSLTAFSRHPFFIELPPENFRSE